MPSHDLNALTRTIAMQKGVSYGEARTILAQRANAAKGAALRHRAEQERRAGLARQIAERISP